MPKPEVSVWIRAKDLASRVVGRVNRTLKGISRVGREVASTFVRITGLAAGVTAALQQLDVRGAKVVGVQEAFNRVFGDSTDHLERLRRAARGTVSDFELMRQANTAVALGSADTVEEVAELIEISRALGRTQGVDAVRALESLNTGIARQSKLYLDNIGIIISVEEANERYAEKLGKSAAALTDQEKRLAFRNAALDQARTKIEELGGAQETATSSGERFAAIVSNIKDGFAAWVALSPQVSSFLEGIALTLREMSGENLVATAVERSLFGINDPRVLEDRLLKTVRAIQQVEEAMKPLEERVRGLGRGPRPDSMLLPGELEQLSELKQELEDLQTEAAAVSRRLVQVARDRAAASGQGSGGGTARNPLLSDGVGPVAGGIFNQLAREQQALRRERERASAGNVGPGGFAAAAAVFSQITREQVRIRTSRAREEREKESDALEREAEKLADAKELAVRSFGEIAEAAIRGSSRMEAAVVQAFTRIAQQRVGDGLLGTVFGVVGGLVSSALNRRPGPVPVRVSDYEPRALDQLKRTNGPVSVTSVMVLPDGTILSIEQAERESFRRQNLDAHVRHSRNGRPVFGGV